METRVVVVGHGMVGSRFVEELVDRDPDGRFAVTVLGAEEYQPYNRVLLSDLVAGRIQAASLALPTTGRTDRRPVEVHLGAAATGLDRHARIVATADGQLHPYDVLVLAAGARARIPPITGLGVGSGTAAVPASLPAGIHVLRSLDDAREIVAATFNARHGVVVGGGVLGLEVATGLARRGVPTTVVHAAEAYMERQLDVGASEVVASCLAGLGIRTMLAAATEEVLTDGRRVRGLRMADGRLLAADLVVLSCGTVAETGLAGDAGLPVERGVVVGPDLASPADHRVFAIGDCAQPPEGGSGLIAQGWDQARRLAADLADRGQSTSAAATRRARQADPTTDVVRVKGSGLDVVTMGLSAATRPATAGHRVIRLSDPSAGRLVEVVVADDRVVGATCVGAGQVAADLTVAYTRGTPLPADPAQLLIRSVTSAPEPTSSPTHMPASMTVCRCNGVTKQDIVSCFSAGARSMSDVAARTRATTGCGGCTDVVTGLLDWLTSSDPDPTPTPVSQSASHPREQDVPDAKQRTHGLETGVS